MAKERGGLKRRVQGVMTEGCWQKRTELTVFKFEVGLGTGFPAIWFGDIETSAKVDTIWKEAS